MEVAHEMNGMKTGQRIALIKETLHSKGASALCPKWGISFDAAPGVSVAIVCAGLNEAANLFHIIEQGFKTGNIVAIQGG